MKESGSDRPENPDPGGQRGCIQGSKRRCPQRFLLNPFSTPKKGRAVQTRDKLTAFKQVPTVPPLQNGGDSGGKGLVAKMTRMDLKDAYFAVPIHQKVPAICMERSNVRVHLPAVRSLNSAKDLHQAIETSGSFPPEKRASDASPIWATF